MGRDFIIALSLANLCLLKVFTYLHFTLCANNQYHSQLPPNTNYFFAAVLNVLILAALFWLAVTLARRSKNSAKMKAVRAAFLLTLVIPLNVVFSFSKIGNNNNFFKIIIFAFAALLVVLLFRMYLKFKKQIIALPVKIVLILFPFLLYNLLHPAYVFLRLDPSDFADQPPAETITTADQNNTRVLWVILDEMDQRLAFEERDAALQMPEIDRFRRESLFADNAYPPGGETEVSLPAFISGRMITSFKFQGPNELLLKTSGENQYAGWSTLPNLFTKAYEHGANTALVGWYHPYGRMMGGSLTSYFWQPYELYRQTTFPEAMVQQIKLTVLSVPLAGRCSLFTQMYNYDEVKIKDRISSFTALIEQSKSAAANPELDFIMVHIPVPHPPGFFDAAKNEYSIKGGGYTDNLALADRSFGEMRNKMEQAGVWENTSVIVTSDHWLRSGDWNADDHRVPFMIKLAGQNDSVEYDQVFNTIVTHDLVLALLKNELNSHGDVAQWISEKRLAWWIPDYGEYQFTNDMQAQ